MRTNHAIVFLAKVSICILPTTLILTPMYQYAIKLFDIESPYLVMSKKPHISIYTFIIS